MVLDALRDRRRLLQVPDEIADQRVLRFRGHAAADLLLCQVTARAAGVALQIQAGGPAGGHDRLLRLGLDFGQFGRSLNRQAVGFRFRLPLGFGPQRGDLGFQAGQPPLDFRYALLGLLPQIACFNQVLADLARAAGIKTAPACLPIR